VLIWRCGGATDIHQQKHPHAAQIDGLKMLEKFK
jgi:hypothetical protein